MRQEKKSNPLPCNLIDRHLGRIMTIERFHHRRNHKANQKSDNDEGYEHLGSGERRKQKIYRRRNKTGHGSRCNRKKTQTATTSEKTGHEEFHGEW